MNRATLHIFLRRQAVGKNKVMVERVLSDDKLFNRLAEAVARETSKRPILDLMKWLIANRKEILDLIKLL